MIFGVGGFFNLIKYLCCRRNISTKYIDEIFKTNLLKGLLLYFQLTLKGTIQDGPLKLYLINKLEDIFAFSRLKYA